jgi:peptidoglycan/LPS O-acetylase OafA/YrhL
VLSIKIAMHFNIANNAFIYFSSFALTIIISALSYEIVEKYFIKKKVKYSSVVSGDNA